VTLPIAVRELKRIPGLRLIARYRLDELVDTTFHELPLK
jgi:hypothetical protein